MLKVCLIGCGSIARAAHGPALRRLQQEGLISLAACCSIDREQVHTFARDFAFARTYLDYEQMLLAEKPDVTFALLPVRQNAACAIRVMELGSAVIMEKPPGVNRAEAEAIADAARRTGRYHGVLFNRRSMPLVQRLKEALKDEHVEAVSLEMCREGRSHEDFTTTAIHGIDCIRYLIGRDFESLDLRYQQDSQHVNYFAYGVFENGIRVDMRFLPCAGAVTERIAVYTRGKQFYLNLPVWSGTTYVPGFDCPGSLVVASGEKTLLSVTGSQLSGCDEGYVLNGFYLEDKIALEALAAGQQSPFPVWQSLQPTEIAAAMREKSSTYRSV